MPEHTDLWIRLGAGLGLLATFWGITWKMEQDMGKKLGKVYNRFDEFKKNIEATHVRKEVCEVVHRQLGADMSEVKADVKELLKLANGNTRT